ncbi:alpha/beta hydrolase [Streptomyces sp. NPDC048441]|uniref:alpha/beta hydrolase n=1 Tax=Streptomyces sp. NPDC048441 TaxID=3365552 RepID=UPI00371542BE
MNRAVRRHPLLLALPLTVAVLGATSLVGCTAVAGPGPEQDPALKSFYGQTLKWKDCGDLECARLTVPRDYSHPENGKTFVLPVAKAATADPDRRIGSLVYNPGGPGAGGVDDLKSDNGEAFGTKARARFDIVSFDPRGVGGSKPAVKCAEEDGEGEAEPLYPRTARDRAHALAGARATAAACVKGSGGILRQVGTEDAARDMDVLRAALGDRKLTYLGWSYGTSLGTSYAELFPHRVRALVLDGAVDPSLGWRERAMSQAVGFRRAVDDYADYCADVAGDSCPGRTPDEIADLIDGLYEQTADEPLPVDGDEYGVDARMVLDVVTTAMYGPEDDWEGLSHALSDAADGDGTKLADLASATEPTEPTDEPAPDSRRKARGDSAAPDNSDTAIVAVSCLDTPHPRTAQPYWNALGRADKAAGVYGTSSVTDELTCEDWPAGTQRPHKVRAEGVPPVLVVGTTGDPATPYEEAESLADQFPGGMLLTYEGLGHTAYGRSNACVTDAVDAYLTALKPVRSGATC